MDPKTIKEAKEFEERVHQSISLMGFQRVKSEILTGTKKADCLFAVTNFGKLQRYAVECKNYKTHLSESDVSHICSTYQPLFDNNDIDNLLIVTKVEISPTAKAHIEKRRNVYHQTVAEIENQIIDFRDYGYSLYSEFTSNPETKYYVPPTGVHYPTSEEYGSLGSQPLISKLEEELLEADRPIAVLGAYGIGKTLLAKALFVRFFERWQEDQGRFPLYIPLVKMAGEQSIESLLGNIFTNEYPADGYNFSKFAILNRGQKFVIILDGLDEMRHLLTWDQFRSNVEEVRKILADNASCILLGRPTAFAQRDEYDYVIHGKKKDRGIITNDDASSFEEYEINPLTSKQIGALAEKYYTTKKVSKKKEDIISLLTSGKHSQISDLAKRPIQLMMLLEILPETRQRLDNLTLWLLYSIFLDKLIQREGKSAARKAFTGPQRRRFAQLMACWLWERGGEPSTNATDIPIEVFDEFVKAGDDVEAVRRDLVASCFLTTQGGEKLRFPHRSIQEFLIAESVHEAISQRGEPTKQKQLQLLKAAALSAETVSLLSSVVQISETRRFLASYFGGGARLSANALAALASGKEIFEHCKVLAPSSVNEMTSLVLCYYVVSNKRNLSDEELEEIAQCLERSLIFASTKYREIDTEGDEATRILSFASLTILAIGVVENLARSGPGRFEASITCLLNFHGSTNISDRDASKLGVSSRKLAKYRDGLNKLLGDIVREAEASLSIERVFSLIQPYLDHRFLVADWEYRGGWASLLERRKASVVFSDFQIQELENRQRREVF